MVDATPFADSPLARAVRDLDGFGYHLIPIIPAGADHDMRGKAPGQFIRGRWQGLPAWQRFRDRAPTEFERGLWARAWPDANVGIVLGTPAGSAASGAQPGDRLIAVDVDSDEPAEIDLIVRALPRSPMVKRGRKGKTLFFAAPASIRSTPYDVPEALSPRGRRRVLDLLTGFDARQTVIPPSLHPSGCDYVWLSGPVASTELPRFDEAALDRLVDVLTGLGWQPKGEATRARPPRAEVVDLDAERRAMHAEAGLSTTWRRPVSASGVFRDVNDLALANLAAWVPALGLSRWSRARAGFAAVASWRPSGSGRPHHERKLNLSIQPGGIRDFGTDDTYTATDLVMKASGRSFSEAQAWLRDRLGMVDDAPIVLAPTRPPERQVERQVDGDTGDTGDTERGHVPESVPHVPAGDVGQVEPAPIVTATVGPFAIVGAVARAPEAVEAAILAARMRTEREAREELPVRLTRASGLVGAIAEWITSTATKPIPALSIGAALTVVGTAAGRFFAGPTRTATHLYVIGLAPTGGGKNHPLAATSRLLTAAGFGRFVGPGQFMSMTAVVARLEREPLALCPMDEVGDFLTRINARRASPHERAITGVLRTAWGASFETMSPPEWAGRVAEPIHAPALSIFGVSTHEEFYAALQGADVLNGFLNRFLLLTTRRRERQEPTTVMHTPPATIVDDLKAIRSGIDPLVAATIHNDRADDPARFATFEGDAGACYRALVTHCEEIEGDAAAFFVRTAEMAQRIATIVAVGNDPARPRITLDVMEWARDLALFSAERMAAEAADFMAETDHQAEARRVLRIIREAGRIPHQRLVAAMKHKLKARDLAGVIESLLEAGEIAAEKEATTGRAAVFYRPT